MHQREKNMNPLEEQQARLIAGFESVGQILPPTMPVDEVVQYLVEKILWLGNFRSLKFALVDWDAHLIRVLEDVSYANLENGRKTSASFLKQHREQVGQVYSLDAEPDDPVCRCAVTRDVVCIVNGNDRYIKTRPDSELAQWQGKAAYFVPLVHKDQTEAVVATGSPIEDEDEMLAWIEFIRPFLNVCGTQLKSVRLIEEMVQAHIKLGSDVERNLSERENDVLRLIAQGLKDAEIADQLHVSVTTVATYKRRIAKKTGLRTKLEMVAYTHQVGLVRPEEEACPPKILLL